MAHVKLERGFDHGQVDTSEETSLGFRSGHRCLAALLFSCALLAPYGCSPSCDDYGRQITEFYAKCGAHEPKYDESTTNPCSEELKKYNRCLVGCFQNASCPTLRGDDGEGQRKLIACETYCNAMFPPLLEDGGGGPVSTQCQQTQQEVETLIESCGATRPGYSDNGECSPKLQAVQECDLACYKKASCEAILGHDNTAFIGIMTCTGLCEGGA